MIFQDKPDQQLCNDDKLVAVLNDGNQAADHTEVIEHIEQCPRCQQRFDELAAGAQDWTKARQALLNDDPCSENRVGSAKWDYSLRNEGPVAWTESMASQLLSPASHPELLGRIGRYDVERLIGSGGMGVVFKAHDSELNRPVAIKILAPYLSSSGPARKRFAREARAAAAVVHEHVVPIYNVETEREIPFLVMHYIAGESLQERVDREGALELCEILRIGMQVASGLSAAHQQGLVHRDIKPSNILMEQGVERALITDFGLARAADDASLTRTGFHPGTPQFMSPEQAAGEQVDARSDLFSLGSVLYTMCTGRPPFRAETSLGVLRRITDVEPRPIREINPNVPEWLCTLIARLMSKSPEDRFANALEVADLLGQCLAHVQQPAGMPLPVAVATTAPIRDRRPPIGKFIAAAAFAMALVLAGVFIVLELNKGTLTIQTEADDIRVRITQGDEVINELKVTKFGQSVRVAAGQYKVEVIGETDDLIVDNEQVTLHRSGNEVVRIVRKVNGKSEHQTTSKQMSADEWQGKLQGNWKVVQQYVDNGVRKPSSYSATVRGNRMELIPTDGQDSMMFDLVLGEKGPPQQIDLKPVMSDLERHQLLQGWSDNDEPLPEDLVNPIFHGIIELDSNGFRICNHLNPCSPRPIQFTDSSERVIWNFSKSERDDSAEVRGTVGSEQPNSRSEWKIKQVFNPAHDQMVWAVAFNPDSKTIASAGADKRIKFWDLASGLLIHTLFRPVNCTDVAFSPDGTYLAIAGGDHGEDPPGELALMSMPNKKTVEEEFILESHETAQYSKSVAFSPDSKWLASGGSDKRVKIWSVKQRNLHIELTGHTELVSQVAFSPNGKILASASFDHTVKLWSVPDGKAIATLRGHDKEVRGVAFSPDSNLLVSVSQDGTARLWNTGSGEPLGVMDGHGGPMFSVAFAQDGRHFATGSRGQSGVMIWDVNTQKAFIPEVSPQQAREIISMTFSADGRMLAIVGSWNGFHIWDQKTVITEQVPSSYLPEGNASDARFAAAERELHDGAKGQSGTDIAKPLYADLQGDWIIKSFSLDEDENSSGLQKQPGGSYIFRAIKVTANQLYFRNPPAAGMTRTSGAISLKPVEGNDPRLFQVVDSQERVRFGMYKVDGDKLTFLLTRATPPKLLAPTKGEFYFECHRAVSTAEKKVLNAIDSLNPDETNVIDGKRAAREQPIPSEVGKHHDDDEPKELFSASKPGTNSTLNFFTESTHKLIISGDVELSEYLHLTIGDEPGAPEWIIGLGGRFIATFEYSDEFSTDEGKEANGLRIGVKHGNQNVSRLQIGMTKGDLVSVSSFRFREGAIGKPMADASILYHEGRYRIGDVETIDGKKLPVFVQLKDVTSAAGTNASPSK